LSIHMEHTQSTMHNSEKKLAALRECFLSFGPDPVENINRLVALCGKLQEATCAIYNRLEKKTLHSIGTWNVSQDYPAVQDADGALCNDLIRSCSEEVVVIRNLPETSYAKTTPLINQYKLKTYVGKVVKLGDVCIGSLCVLYQNDYVSNEDDKQLISIIASAIGIEEKRRVAEDAFKDGLELRKIITTISANFINLEVSQIDNEINKALQSIGEFVGADRSYIFLIRDNQKKMDNTHEWCAQGIPPQIQSLQGLLVDNFPWFAAKLKRLEVIVVPRVADLSEDAHFEKMVFESGGIQSLLNVPMVYRGVLFGFLGFDAVKEEREWSEESVLILKLLGEIFVNALERKHIEQTLQETQERYRRVIRGVSGYVYTVRIENGHPVETLHGPACVSVTGYAPEEFASDPHLWLKMVHEQDKTIVQEYARDVLAGKATQPIEHRIMRKDGKVIWIRNTPVLHFDNRGRLLSYDGLIQDITERKRVEEALQQGERFLSDIFGSIQDGISILDTELNIVRVNSVFEEKWHKYAMPLVGKKCYQAYHGFNQPCSFCPSIRTLRTGKAAYEVVPRHGQEGKIVGWLDLYSFPLVDTATGKIKGVIEYVRDITERKVAEEELKKSQERYRAIVEDQTDFINRFLPDGTITFTNEVCARFFDKKAGELIGKRIYQFIHKDEIDRVKDLLASLNQNNPVKTIEHRVVLSDGEVRWQQWTNRAIFDHEGRVVEFQSVGRDITEHKKMEDAQRQAERFLSNVFSSIQDGLSILDTNLTIMRVNSTMEKWYSYAMPLVGKKCYEAYHGRDIPCETCPTRLTLETGQAACKIVPKRALGGKAVGWLELYSFPLIDKPTGHTTGVIEYVRDISERIKAEEGLASVNKELVKTNRRLKQLAVRDSHTGLYNHRYLDEIVESEFARAKRYGHALSVVMLDIDYFKSINDVYGHQFGDIILKQFAKLVKKMLRRYDTVVRYGGEEFILICPGTDRQQITILAQRLLDAINLFNFGNTQHVLKLKLSIAVTAYPDDRALRGMDLVELADQILNRVKESGGNKVYSSLDVAHAKPKYDKEAKATTDVSFLKEKLSKLTKRANQSLIEAVFAFAKTIEVKDHYTGAHAEHTVKYATDIAEALGLSDQEIENIKQAATLHDLGKIGVRESILLKKTALTKKEFNEMKKHPQIGADIIRPIQFLHAVIPLILYHHERWDGKGYPNGLKGEEIPIGARIVSLADAYQALTSDRPYRKAYSQAKAIQIIEEETGMRYDPKIVSVFLKIIDKKK
jgi:diguanylate cyclase (GGDEF)-like protein/PAS domain S-box-containing protein